MRSKPSSPSKRRSATTLLERLGLSTPLDFVLHFPIRYEDQTSLQTISVATPGRHLQIEGEVVSSEVIYRPRKYLTAQFRDNTGTIQLRWLNFYPSQIQQMQAGKRWRVRGEIRAGYQGLEMVHPKVSSPSQPLPTSLTPVYPSTEGLAQRAIRQHIETALQTVDLSDTLPPAVVQAYGLLSFEQAVDILHRPKPGDDLVCLEDRTHPAWLRVKFDELLAQQLSLAYAREQRRERRAEPLLPPTDRISLADKLLAHLPFQLTGAQQRVVAEIHADLAQSYPMHRLLQGDVGSGKTVVAALAAMRAIDNGKQAAVMAPTEILAEQHFLKLEPWARALGLRCVWLSAGLRAPVKRKALAEIACGQAQLVVGTQALIQSGVEFHDLGLAIVDEQHRFGVSQRLSLGGKALGGLPHQLTMSATPIPRSLAMTFFGDLDVSVIDERPPGRLPVKTKLVSASRRTQVIEGLRDSVNKGGQVYWVCPLVEESEALQLQTAVDTHEMLRQALPGLTVGLVHGRMSAADKTEVMQRFKTGEISVLVATTVIEVGVDVPNASQMVIEHAERFGLAQLHQLRGRVGRGTRESVCVLMYEPPLSAEAKYRLKAMYETDDGFEIARRDLQLRGPGEFLGARQSGLSLLRFADFEADAHWVTRAKELAQRLRQEYPDIARRHINRWMQGREAYLNG
ncbi:ATP-dependent DNA helicase RecG [Orrella daihaiensis]|uniref:ATP-dependent DNA helicase RecG n=1 Tax=Orrella daihaiensis TaxID=2782176 RepID=A0ABY4AGC4_9BURK|nr:ATP-dependent DNA helicase RecG [Orrella daihaiensis]UOD49335.1 ATP-dependent DNA helicase RecG [Orrella daihaiensis]